MFKASVIVGVVAAHNWDERNTVSNGHADTANSAIEDLSGEVREERNNNEQVQGELGIEQENVRSLQGDLATAESKQKALNEEQRELKATIESLKKTGEDLDAKFDATTTQAKTDIGELDDTIQKLKDEIAELVESHAGIISEKEAEIAATFDELAEVDTTILSQESAIMGLEADITAAEGAYADAVDCNAQADARVASINADFKKMNEIFAIDQAAREENIAGLGKDISNVESTIAEQETTLSGLSADIQAMMDKAANIPDVVTFAVQEIFNEFMSNTASADLTRRLQVAMGY